MSLELLIIDDNYLLQLNPNNPFTQAYEDFSKLQDGATVELHKIEQKALWQEYREDLRNIIYIHAITKHLKIRSVNIADISRLKLSFGNNLRGDNQTGFYYKKE